MNITKKLLVTDINDYLIDCIEHRRTQLQLNFTQLRDLTGFHYSTITRILGRVTQGQTEEVKFNKHSQRFKSLLHICKMLNIDVSFKLPCVSEQFSDDIQGIMKAMCKYALDSGANNTIATTIFMRQARYMVYGGPVPQYTLGFLGIAAVYECLGGDIAIQVTPGAFYNRSLLAGKAKGKVRADTADLKWSQKKLTSFKVPVNSIFNLAAFV